MQMKLFEGNKRKSLEDVGGSEGRKSSWLFWLNKESYPFYRNSISISRTKARNFAPSFTSVASDKIAWIICDSSNNRNNRK